MTVLCAIALVAGSIAFSFLAADHFIRLGMNLQKQKEQELFFSPSPPPPPTQTFFVQRLPGQEPGDVEELPNNVIYVKGWIQ
jgi:hypothetical protein